MLVLDPLKFSKTPLFEIKSSVVKFSIFSEIVNFKVAFWSRLIKSLFDSKLSTNGLISSTSITDTWTNKEPIFWFLSVTIKVISYTLSPLKSNGFSKSGEDTNDKFPPSILKLSVSSPLISQTTSSLSQS